MLVVIWLFLPGNFVKCSNQRSWKTSWHSVPDVIRCILCMFFTQKFLQRVGIYSMFVWEMWVSATHTHRDTICLPQTTLKSKAPVFFFFLQGWRTGDHYQRTKWFLSRTWCNHIAMKHHLEEGIQVSNFLIHTFQCLSNETIVQLQLWSDPMLQTAKVVYRSFTEGGKCRSLSIRIPALFIT